METFTHHPLFQILKGGVSQPQGVQQSLDMKTCFSNLPMFMRAMQAARRDNKVYKIDEQFLSALKAML